MVLNERDRRLIEALQDGLPLVSHPYAALAERAGMSEAEVIERLGELLEEGAIKRMGVVVRHHELGYRANAMVVWDVPDTQVEDVGRRLGRVDCVNLCYRRPRRGPDWPYNLFCMIHGRDRDSVLERIGEIRAALELEAVPHTVLFSQRRFKQRGARYVHAPRLEVVRG